MPYYVIDENNNKQEAYTKEEILSVIAQAIADGSLAGISADAGFISKIKCSCTGTTIKEAFITQAQYNALEAAGTLDAHTEYNIIDDTTCEDIDASFKNIDASISGFTTQLNNVNTSLGNRITALENKTAAPITITDNRYVLIAKAGLYAVNVEWAELIDETMTTYRHSAVISIDNLNTDVAVVYNDRFGTKSNINYNSYTGYLTSDQETTITKCVLIMAY